MLIFHILISRSLCGNLKSSLDNLAIKMDSALSAKKCYNEVTTHCRFLLWRNISKYANIWQIDYQFVSTIERWQYFSKYCRTFNKAHPPAIQEFLTVGIWACYMAKNSYKDFTAFFTPIKYADQKNVREKNIPQWLFEGSTT